MTADAERLAAEVEAAWKEHSTGFSWPSGEAEYGEYRAFGAGYALVAAERDALRARIEAALGHAFEYQDSNGGWPHVVALMHAALAGDQPEATPERCMNTIGPSSNGGRWGACSLPKGHWLDGSDCRDEATPEPIRPCRGCSFTEAACVEARAGGARACCPECDHTPEPPHLDPEPMTWGLGRNRHAVTSWCRVEPACEFDPRPADENGKAYSRKREEYP